MAPLRFASINGSDLDDDNIELARGNTRRHWRVSSTRLQLMFGVFQGKLWNLITCLVCQTSFRLPRMFVNYSKAYHELVFLAGLKTTLRVDHSSCRMNLEFPFSSATFDAVLNLAVDTDVFVVRQYLVAWFQSLVSYQTT